MADMECKIRKVETADKGVFKRKEGSETVRWIRYQGQTSWREIEGSPERIEVFGDQETRRFYVREEFKKLMTERRKARAEAKAREEAECWPPLMRERGMFANQGGGRHECVRGTVFSARNRPVGHQHYP